MKHKKLQKENLKLRTTMAELNKCNRKLQEQSQSRRTKLRDILNHFKKWKGMKKAYRIMGYH